MLGGGHVYLVCLQHPVRPPVVAPVVVHDHEPHPTIVRLLVWTKEQAVVKPGLLAGVHIVERSLKSWLWKKGKTLDFFATCSVTQLSGTGSLMSGSVMSSLSVSGSWGR